jgi:predicted transcriptional regulator
MVVGMITDRDICMAVGTRNRLPSEISVFEVKAEPQALYACAPDDDIHAALKTMRTYGVRRLPVVNAAGGLEGILTFDDVIQLLSEELSDLATLLAREEKRERMHGLEP